MGWIRVLGLFVICAAMAPAAEAGGAQGDLSLADAPRAAVSEDASVAQPAIAQLRDAGPAGLQMFLTEHAAALTAFRESPVKTPEIARLLDALDSICQQKDCYASSLYWYTDLEQAKAAAQASGKPILSLRMLGQLKDELSCANSRYFRTILYANNEVSKRLQNRFILHWSSERPVPTVTVDYGDGRRLETTITGNSIHYILAADGNVIDALPGLYGPGAFLSALERAETAAKSLALQPESGRERFLRQYHRDELAATAENWERDLTAAKVRRPRRSFTGTSAVVKTWWEDAAAVVGRLAIAGVPPVEAAVDARQAARVAGAKSAGEYRVLDQVAIAPGWDETFAEPRIIAELNELDDAGWRQIAALHQADARLDPGSWRLVRKQLSRRASVEPVIASFERLVALDTVRNEYVLRRRIHTWFAQGQVRDMDSLNRRVYSELFLTPGTDPWLGLAPGDAYAALEDAGIVRP